MASYTKTETQQRIQRRRQVYRSLMQRGVVKTDPSLMAVGGSVYDSMAKYLQEEYASKGIDISSLLESWYDALLPIYDDETLDKPEGWDAFLIYLDTACRNPQSGVNGNLRNVIDNALEKYNIELMAVETAPTSMADEELY